MKMNKESDQEYLVTIYKEISILQAFFISISCIDRKLAS